MLRSIIQSSFLEYPVRYLLKSFSKNNSVIANQSLILIFLKHIRKNSNCIDIGASKGSIFKHMNRLAPNGIHYAFEPIPSSFNPLHEQYKGSKNIFLKNLAISNYDGTAKFNFIQNFPGYSGLKLTEYPKSKKKEVLEIDVEVRKLDSVLSLGYSPDIIKIDVEGNEYSVFEGAYETLKKNNPIIIFEHAKGLSESYGTNSTQVYDFLVKKLNYKLYTLETFLHGNHELSEIEFENCYHIKNSHDYVAHK